LTIRRCAEEYARLKETGLAIGWPWGAVGRREAGNLKFWETGGADPQVFSFSGFRPASLRHPGRDAGSVMLGTHCFLSTPYLLEEKAQDISVLGLSVQRKGGGETL
jgi:hypothetical protein